MAGVDLLRQEAVLRLVRALAAAAPLVIGLEDLQWADADTVGAVEYLADNLGDVRVLCLVTVRSEPRSAAYQLMHALVARRSIHAFSLDRCRARKRLPWCGRVGPRPPPRTSSVLSVSPMGCRS